MERFKIFLLTVAVCVLVTSQESTTDPPVPQIQSEWSEAFHGEKVSLKCVIHGSNSWNYMWFKDLNEIVSSDETNIQGNTLTLSVQSDHGGMYECQAELQDRNVTTPKSPAHSLRVHELPKPELSIVSQWKTFYPTEKLTLKCSIKEDSDKWDYEWFRNGALLSQDKDISFSGNTLSISSVNVVHAGNYTCRGKHQTRKPVTTGETEALQINVYDTTPKPTITKHHWFEPFYSTERVQLNCNMPGVGWEYHWYKNETLHITNPELTISSVSHTHIGDYQCKAQRGDFSVNSETLQVQVQDPPEPQIQSEWSEAYHGEKVSLKCVIHGSNSWKYTWFRDQNIVSSDGTNIQGNTLTLSVQSDHGGEYECQAELQDRNVMTARSPQHSLTVHELPKPELSIMPQWKTFYQTEKLTLKCSIKEDSNKWDYEWFKNGAPLPSSGNTLSISSVNVVHAGQYTCRGKHQTRKPVTTGETEALQLNVHDTTPKPTITKHPWFEPFYSKERVQLNCNMTGVGWEYHWYKGSNRLTTSPEFTIDSVSHTHIGDYHCKAQRGDFSVNSETLQVRVQDPPKPQIQSEWSEAFHGEKVSLQCVIQESESWKYTWFRDQNKIVSSDGTNIQGNTLTLSVQSDHGGEYECQAELQNRKVMTAKSPQHSLTVHGPQPTIVLKQDPSYPEIYTGEQVKLTCSIQEKTSKWQYIWEKDSRQVNTDPSNPVYTIQSASLSENGEYTCQVRRGEKTSSKSRKLTVKDPPKPELSIMSQWKTFYPTEKLTLKCSIKEDSDKWDYEWFRNGALLSQDKDISFSGSTLSISSVNVVHVGQYTCRGRHQTRKPVTTGKTEALQLNVHDTTPKPTITKHPWFEPFYSKERVQLNCNMPGVGWEYHWYKGSNRLTTNPEFTIDSVSVTDTGDYQCKAQRGDFSVNSETLRVRVQDPPVPQIQSEWSEAFHGEKVSLQCVIQDSKTWNYTWFRDQNKMVSKDGTIIMIGNNLTLLVQSDHGGVYECQAELQDRKVTTARSPQHSLTVHGPQPTIVLKQDPSYPEIYTGEQVKLTCSIQEKTSKWQYIWQKDSRQVNTDPSNPVYTIQSASLSENGEYTCQVRRGEKTSSKSRKLTVKDPPKPELSIMSQWKTFYPTEKLTLKCSIKEDSDKWDYEWFRNGALLSQDKDISFSGSTLSISSVKADHSGQYTCRGKHQTRKPVTTGKTEALQLHVHDKTPKADISKHEWFEFFYSEERVHLNCTMSGVGWQYQWYKGSSPLIKNAELAFSSVSHTHIGNYHCKAQRGDFSVNSETLQVQVQARPAVSLSLETELGDIMTGDMTLRCNVSDGRQWNYTWFMNGQQLNETSDLLKRKGNEETIKSEFKCKGINTERPLYSALSDGFIANNIIFKRKILLAISLCLVCCIVILIIGCIVLKITRKPEVKETAQDDLFFSMTDSKIQAASPMKEYMDNSPTELEECQEKEELITDRTSAVQEDAVIKDEETPASEANGLISFKGL